MLIVVTLYAQEVLGYSTVEFGLGDAVMTVMSVVGAVSGQALGIAVLSTVEVARTDDVLSGSDPPTSNATAPTEGFQAAFLVGLGIAAGGALLAVGVRRQG